MLSYRHAFHAGNHADVLKHWIYSLVLDYFNQKDKPYWVIDTHAGAGAYRLTDAAASKTAEYEAGIARLQAADTEHRLAVYLQAVQQFRQQHGANTYPGSPSIAQSFLRQADKLRLFELHPADAQLLSDLFSQQKRQTAVAVKDGFEGIKACLPPPTKRGLVLIDPPYEVKDDYQRVVDCLKDSLKRFATGTYLIWYPRLQRPEPALMLEKLRQLNTDYLHVTLDVHAPRTDGFGMYGSGMWVINPPWTLQASVTAHLDWLANALAQDAHAHASCEGRQR